MSILRNTIVCCVHAAVRPLWHYRGNITILGRANMEAEISQGENMEGGVGAFWTITFKATGGLLSILDDLP